MNPANIGCLTAAGVDVWSLANNHVLDHGTPGLLETVDAMRGAGLRTAGAGADETEAWTPAVVERDGTRVVVTSVGHASSGIPSAWAARPGRPGVALLRDLSDPSAAAVAEAMLEDARPGDLRVVSVHWGGNWGYDVPADHRRFARRLVEAGVHVVHGHSSHHPRPVEVHRGGLVLYGCGDLVDDYEGIGGYESFRDELRLLYFVRLSPAGGLEELSMVPFQARQMRLWRANREDADWLASTLADACRRFGSSVSVTGEGSLVLDAG
jgi:poly-gamma-glutamate synthesis protein (capsule biosynthesis protein)